MQTSHTQSLYSSCLNRLTFSCCCFFFFFLEFTVEVFIFVASRAQRLSVGFQEPGRVADTRNDLSSCGAQEAAQTCSVCVKMRVCLTGACDPRLQGGNVRAGLSMCGQQNYFKQLCDFFWLSTPSFMLFAASEETLC